MKLLTFLAFLLSVCPFGCLLAEDAPLTLDQAEIPREEIRQQVLSGRQEYRYDYLLTTPQLSTDLFAECFVDGQMKHRFRLTSAMHSQKPEYEKGTLSVGWSPRIRELVVLNDTGFGVLGGWIGRVVLPQDVLTRLYHVIYSHRPVAEKKRDSSDTSQEVVVFPVVALVGEPEHPPFPQSRIRSLSTTADLLRDAASEQMKQCIIIYMYASIGGGEPPLHFDEPQSP